VRAAVSSIICTPPGDLAKSDADWSGYTTTTCVTIFTVIPSRTLCGEWVKTKGHLSSEEPCRDRLSAEIYEVIEGQAHYLLQSQTLDDAVMISARAGDLVINPAGLWHIYHQPFSGHNLTMANIVSTAFAKRVW